MSWLLGSNCRGGGGGGINHDKPFSLLPDSCRPPPLPPPPFPWSMMAPSFNDNGKHQLRHLTQMLPIIKPSHGELVQRIHQLAQEVRMTSQEKNREKK